MATLEDHFLRLLLAGKVVDVFGDVSLPLFGFKPLLGADVGGSQTPKPIVLTGVGLREVNESDRFVFTLVLNYQILDPLACKVCRLPSVIGRLVLANGVVLSVSNPTNKL